MHQKSCHVCGDTRRCVICLGQGVVRMTKDRLGHGTYTECAFCRGTGLCSECQAEAIALVIAERGTK